MKTHLHTAILAFATIGAFATPGHSQQTLTLEYPLVSGDNTGVTSFDPVTRLLEVKSTPRIIEPDGNFAQYIFPEVITGAYPSITIQFTIDPVDDLIDGVVGDDFEMIGSIDMDGDFIPDITGVLLTAEILDFSYIDNDATDIYDFRFEITGGIIASWFPTGNFAVINTSENSSFNGEFTEEFSGEGKVSLGSVDKLLTLEGLTPGFWKQDHHSRAWEDAGVSLDAKYDTTFDVNAYGDETLFGTISSQQKKSSFISHSIAAYLNASHPTIDYAYTVEEVIEMVQTAFATDTCEEVKDLFEAENELDANLGEFSKDNW